MHIALCSSSYSQAFSAPYNKEDFWCIPTYEHERVHLEHFLNGHHMMEEIPSPSEQKDKMYVEQLVCLYW